MIKRFLVQSGSVIVSVMFMLGVAAAEQAKSKDHVSAEQFLTEAAQGGLAEVALGRMAADKGENEAVKDFGRRMVQDHGKANDELKSLATIVRVPVPTEMSAETQATQQRLGKLSGAEFDRMYMSEMLNDHRKDIAAFEQQAEHGQNPQVKAWAKKTLPKLKEHLNLAQSAMKQVSTKNGTNIDASGGMRAAVSDSHANDEAGKIADDQ